MDYFPFLRKNNASTRFAVATAKIVMEKGTGFAYLSCRKTITAALYAKNSAAVTKKYELSPLSDGCLDMVAL